MGLIHRTVCWKEKKSCKVKKMKKLNVVSMRKRCVKLLLTTKPSKREEALEG
jgi:hypothetical protein